MNEIAILEREVEASLVKAVKGAGGYCLKWVSPGQAGVPDRICLLPGGRVIFVELKRPTGGVYGLRQQAWAQRLSRLGFRVELLKTKDEIRALVSELAGPENNTCVCCGRVIPEGRHVCRICEREAGL